MPTAKSYIDWECAGRPYIKGTNKYIKVINPKTLKEKEVRYYSIKEYEKKWGECPFKVDPFVTPKETLFGFDKGYIDIIPDIKVDDEICEASPARYATSIGWYFYSTDDIPNDFPYKTKQLTLEEYKNSK